ncbi:hypothetical protein HU200_029178 [Digitaria exilis]|uniref:Uncharacterized protein n=1 Tax=Digitaria exilis TaxID=1010633 RepID=A0A835BQV3_9POAL|nr:hypothetical protein HU200_029178 [Digitaria exilis]CAB3489346.1 unnamed protein product [Digitaria exilis]
MAAAIDDSCRRPGSVPFKWEVCPGTPKHVRSASASAAPPSFSSSSTTTYASSNNKVAVSPKLTPPPAMSPSPYHSPRISYSYYAARSASISPSRRRPPPHRPMAFLDIAPRVAPAAYGAAAEAEESPAAMARCFPLPVFRRRDREGKKGGAWRSGASASSTSSSGSSFRSDGASQAARVSLRRSASSSSSSCLSLSSRSSGKIAEAREVEAAGGWFY